VARSVRAEILIDAPIERVWQILCDLGRYGEWNPFTPRVESSLRIGDPIHLHVRLVGERLMHRIEWVTRNEPHALCWDMKMGVRALLTAERCQVLTAQDEGRTRYVTEDRFTGLLTPIVFALFGRAMQRGFEDCARGLKKRAES
jgi:hypothetical protein